MTARVSTIRQCPYRYSNAPAFRCGTFDQSPRKRCEGCASELHTVRGYAIVTPHRGDGRYSLADAVRVYASMRAADSAASRAYERDNRSTLVARFIPAINEETR